MKLNWSMSAGGTCAAPDKHGYSARAEDLGLVYHVSPVSSRTGRHLGYQLTRFGGGKSWRWWRGGLFNRAAAARKAAEFDAIVPSDDASWVAVPVYASAHPV